MFDVVLAGHPAAPGRRRFAAPAAVAAHVLVLGGALALSAWKIGEIAEPNIPVAFFAESAPPSPPAPPGAPDAGRRLPASSLPQAAPPVPPIPAPLAPETLSPIAVSPILPSAGIGDFGAGTEARGRADGIPGGTGSGEGGGFSGDEVLPEQTPNVAAPRLLLQVPPEYPEAARRARQQGTVVLQAVIGTGGGVEDIRVLSSASPFFDAPAVAALRRWRYAPATRDRRAVRVYLTVTILFTLH